MGMLVAVSLGAVVAAVEAWRGWQGKVKIRVWMAGGGEGGNMEEDKCEKEGQKEEGMVVKKRKPD
jgi:hypothetical protein